LREGKHMVCRRNSANEKAIMYDLRDPNLYVKICKMWDEGKFEK
jgi:hypothetical protein